MCSSAASHLCKFFPRKRFRHPLPHWSPLMLRIPLTQGRFALVDDQDYLQLTYWNWRYSSNGYAVRTHLVNGEYQYFWMHRVIMAAPPDKIVDHISGNRLDNRRCNLRLVTANQNQWNRRKNANGSSPYKSVCWHQRGWCARIRVNGQRIHLAYSSDAERAARLYDAAAYHFFGAEYAVVNFPDEAIAPDIQAWLLDILAVRQRE
jgi:hypothetical protein